MKKFFQKYISGILTVVLLSSAFLGLIPATTHAYTLPVAGQNYTLAGSGVSSSATSFTLQSFTVTQTGYKLLTSDIGDITYFTLEPGNISRQEIVGCTTVTQNSSGTATISNCTRGLSPISPYTSSSSFKFTHGGGTQVIISNPPQFHNLYTAKANDEPVTGSWTFPTPLSNSNPATKGYVDSVVSGGSVVNSAVVVPGTAGATLTQGQVLYEKQSDGRWYPANVSVSEASSTILGIAQGAGTGGGAIATGVLVNGLDINQSGLTIGTNYFLGNTLGTISSATSSRYVGRARSATSLYFDTYSVPPSSIAASTTVTGTNATIGQFDPVGSITAFASTTAPNGWLLVDGSSVLRSSYPALFAVIGGSYGTVDGTHFTLPDIRGRNILMASTTANIAQTGGESGHVQTLNELASHTHTINSNTAGGTYGYTVTGSGSGGATQLTGSAGGSAAMNVLDPYIVLQYIIKY